MLNKNIEKIGFENIPNSFKPTWSKFNQKIRRIGLELIPALNNWPITDIDKARHIEKKKHGTVKIDWKWRLKQVHNCPFLLPKYSQLIYHIITDTLKSGHWIIKCRLRTANGRCPCCHIPQPPDDSDAPTLTPATTRHMFSTCIMVQEVWSEANQLGHSFWSNYTDFNYDKDITLLVHEYEPVKLFKLATIWALWRFWCSLFYEPETFTPDRLSNMMPEVMMMVKTELIFRLIECRPVIEWIDIVRKAHRDLQPGDPDRLPEKEFLLIRSQNITTNPDEFNLPMDNELVLAWLGNNTLCYIRNKKIIFNHANWFIYSNRLESNMNEYPDSQEDSDNDEQLPPFAAFLIHDY